MHYNFIRKQENKVNLKAFEDKAQQKHLHKQTKSLNKLEIKPGKVNLTKERLKDVRYQEYTEMTLDCG